MSSSAEMDQSEEQVRRPGFVQSVWQALSGSRIPTSEERTRKSPDPVFEEQDAGTTNRELASVGSVGFAEEKVTDLARVDEIRPRESPLTFYSDRQLGMELDPDAGRQARIDFAARNSRAFSSPLHPQPTVRFVSGRDLVFSGPTPPLAIRGLAGQNFSQASPHQYLSVLAATRGECQVILHLVWGGMMEATSPSEMPSALKKDRGTRRTSNVFRWGHPGAWRDYQIRLSLFQVRQDRTSSPLRVRALQFVRGFRVPVGRMGLHVHKQSLKCKGTLTVFRNHGLKFV
jgi:hypothetical protein